MKLPAMRRKKIVISEFMDQAAVNQLRQDFDVLHEPQLVADPVALLRAVSDCDALIVRNMTQVRGDLLSAGVKLAVVGRSGVGLDNIDLDTCRSRGIQVIPATGANALAVAEYVLAASMLLLRGAYFSSVEVASGQWPRSSVSSGRELCGKTLGLVGFGVIGQLTAHKALALGMRVIAYDPALLADSTIWSDTGVMCAPLDIVLTQSDVVSLHVPLTGQTRHLLSADRIAGMRQGAIVINTSRGGIVDESAVAAALRSGHLGGAALDVFATEPLLATGEWMDCPNVLLTPHVAGLTTEANERVSSLVASGEAKALV